jgi:hypothetical protein
VTAKIEDTADRDPGGLTAALNDGLVWYPRRDVVAACASNVVACVVQEADTLSERLEFPATVYEAMKQKLAEYPEGKLQ